MVATDERLRPGGDVLGDQMHFDGVGMDSVIDLGQRSIQIPAQGKTAVLFRLQSLIILDNIQLELRRNPGCEFKRNVRLPSQLPRIRGN